MGQYELSAFQWQRIEDFLPGRPGHVGVRWTQETGSSAHLVKGIEIGRREWMCRGR